MTFEELKVQHKLYGELLNIASKRQVEIARAGYCLERALVKLCASMTRPEQQVMRETIMNAIAFARGKLPMTCEDLPRGAMLRPRGRGLTNPIVRTFATPAGLDVRIDDDGKPDYWLEWSIPAWRLAELLGQVYTMQDHADDGGPGGS